MHSRTAVERTALLLGIMIACSPTLHTTPTRSPTKSSIAPQPERASWQLSHRAATLHYVVHDSSVLSISTDTIAKEIPFITTAFLQLVTSALGDSFQFNARIDSSSVRSELQTKSSVDTSLQVSGIISHQGGIIQLHPTGISSCKVGIEPVFGRIAELFIRMPPRIIIGSQWTDTSTAPICYGKTSLRQTSIRSYRLIADTTWQGDSALKVDRSTILSVSGLEADSSKHISATGIGSSTATLFLDRVTGEVLETLTRGIVTLTITSGRGTFPFRQISYTEVHRQ